ncbi:MAG: sigma 54-interacting transcriptional regulator [Polyangiaceae bacterium]
MTSGAETTIAADAPDLSPGRALQAKVVVVGGPDLGKEMAVTGEHVVGSAEGVALRLSDPRVSRRHAEFRLVDRRLMVRDLGSRNGTYLGHTRVVESEAPLGSLVQVGDSTLAVQPRWYTREVPPSEHSEFGDLVGTSLRMREIFAILERVSSTDVTVLIEGESGTGKELAARALRNASLRATRPYVIFDCAAVPRDLAESELFGHKRGAFSGAVADRAGAFQQAHGGTIYLDELGELPLELQPKLLRVLETAEVRRVGDDTMRKVDVRVIAATNRDLQAEVRRGRFREDLLYRLEVVKIRLPPLRERLEDVPTLVQRLLAGKLDVDAPITGSNLNRLVSYAWPGNVRELRNVLDRALALSDQSRGKPSFGDLVLNLGPTEDQPSTLGSQLPGVASPLPFKDAKELLLSQFERAYLDALLERHRGNHTQAAEAAGLSRKHLYDLLRKHFGNVSGSDD